MEFLTLVGGGEVNPSDWMRVSESLVIVCNRHPQSVDASLVVARSFTVWVGFCANNNREQLIGADLRVFTIANCRCHNSSRRRRKVTSQDETNQPVATDDSSASQVYKYCHNRSESSDLQ